MDSLIGGSGGSSPKQEESSAPPGGPKKLVERILHRKAPEASSPGSSASAHKRSVIERLEGFFVPDLPTETGNFPPPPQEDPVPAPSSEATAPAQGKEPAATAADSGAPADTDAGSAYSAVRLIRSAAKDAMTRSQDAFHEMEAALKAYAQEFEQRREALTSATQAASACLQELSAQAAQDAADQFAKVSEPALTQSIQRLKDESEAAAARSAQQFKEQSEQAAAELRQKLDTEKQQFLTLTQSEFDTLRASRQAFLDDTQKETAASVQRSLDSLADAAIEKARAGFEQSRANLMSETQAQLVSNFRASLDLLSKDAAQDLIDRAQGELAALRTRFIDETQGQLDRMVAASAERLQTVAAAALQQVGAGLAASSQQCLEQSKAQLAALGSSTLEPEVASAVERGRRELGRMVDGFLGKAVPQIQAELEKLISRHMENARALAAEAAAQPAARPLPQPVPLETATLRTAAPFSAPRPNPAQTDPMAITTSQLARLQMGEPGRSTPAGTAPARTVASLGRGLDFRLAESAGKPHRIAVRDVKAGISSGLKLGLGLGIIALLVIAAYFALSPVIRLRPNPPAAFFNTNQTWTAAQRTRENDVARAYWAVAVTRIAPLYPFGSTLPANPPDEFVLTETAAPGTATIAGAEARTRYWQNLQAVWAQPQAWERTSNWDVDSLRIWLNHAVVRVNRLFSSRGSSSS